MLHIQVYDPTELERNFLTEGDSAIRVNDAPERFQLRALRSVPVIPSTEAQLQSEMGMTEAEFGQTDLDEEALFIQTALGRRPYSSQVFVPHSRILSLLCKVEDTLA